MTPERTSSQNKDFTRLIIKLDANLKISDGEDHDFYNQFNGIDDLKHVILIYQEDVAIACGAIKVYDQHSVEIKRMYVSPHYRRQGVAARILLELENWARELGIKRCILETGKKQPDAIRLYQKNNYVITSNYAQYKGIENSVCFEKILT